MRSMPLAGLCGLVLCTVAHAAEAPAKQPPAVPAAQAAAALRARFADPPARFRILKIVHNVPEAADAQDKLLKSLADQGFGGMVTNVPFKDYLQSDTQWGVFVRAVNEAKRAGMAMWLYDERGYPSGNAGGLTMRNHPEWEARGLLVADAASSGGAVALDVPPGRLVRAAAFPLADGAIDVDKGVDLAERVRDGKLQWNAPAGQWRVMAITEDRLYEGTHAAVNLADHRPYVNLLLPEATAEFLKVTHDAYAARLDKDLGKWFLGTFTDEPSLMSMFFKQQPYRVLPWGPNVPREFQKRRGYALEPLLPALAADAGPRGARARYDFWLTIAELVSDSYFRQIRDWGRRHNIPSGGHLLLEEPILTHVPLYGDLFRCERLLDAPSLDCLSSLPPEVHWYSARLVASAAELEGRPDTMCETSDHAQRHRPPGDTRPPRRVTEEEIRGTCNRLILSGMTCITSYYSFHGLTDEQLRRLNRWVGRCCAALYGGRQVTDVAVLYPIESVWPKFVPSRLWVQGLPPAAQQIERAYRNTAEQLFAHRRDFTFIDARTLVEGVVAEGTLKYPGTASVVAPAKTGLSPSNPLAWRVVVLPAVDTLPLKAWENLARFWRSGGIVIAVGALPANSETEFPAAAVQALSKEIFGDGAAARCNVNAAGGAAVYLSLGREERLAPLLDALIEPEVFAADVRAPLRITHRRIAGQEIFFVINDSPAAWEGSVDLAASGAGEQLDPATGAVVPLAGPKGIRMKLDAYGGVLFRFDSARLPVRKNPTAKDIQAIIQ